MLKPTHTQTVPVGPITNVKVSHSIDPDEGYSLFEYERDLTHGEKAFVEARNGFAIDRLTWLDSKRLRVQLKR